MKTTTKIFNDVFIQYRKAQEKLLGRKLTPEEFDTFMGGFTCGATLNSKALSSFSLMDSPDDIRAFAKEVVELPCVREVGVTGTLKEDITIFHS